MVGAGAYDVSEKRLSEPGLFGLEKSGREPNCCLPLPRRGLWKRQRQMLLGGAQ